MTFLYHERGRRDCRVGDAPYEPLFASRTQPRGEHRGAAIWRTRVGCCSTCASARSAGVSTCAALGGVFVHAARIRRPAREKGYPEPYLQGVRFRGESQPFSTPPRGGRRGLSVARSQPFSMAPGGGQPLGSQPFSSRRESRRRVSRKAPRPDTGIAELGKEIHSIKGTRAYTARASEEPLYCTP